MATRRTSRKAKIEWTPQMQFSKRIARIILIYWLVFVTAVFVMLVIFQATDALLTLTGWVTMVMITMIGAYTGNSIYEKHLDKGFDKRFYVTKLTQDDNEEEEEKLTESENG